ncbi:MAG: ADYC domain-containing protein [Dongiaceae bacterium]
MTALLPIRTSTRLAAAGLLLLLAAGAAAAESPAVSAVEVQRTAMTVRLADGRRLAGAALVGLTVEIPVGSDGKPMAVRIDAVAPDPRDRSGETTLYALSVADGPGGARRALCQPDPFGERWGFPLAAAYDAAGRAAGPVAITCTAGAQAKCIRFGYRPWHPEMVALHAACTHMVRADYCGDGRPHTRNGTRINYYDHGGVIVDDPWPGMSFEAAWTPQGAACVARTRIPAVATLEQVLAECPRLRAAANGPGCTDRAPGAILFNRSFAPGEGAAGETH